ncbi:beta-porphyranase A-like [Liolophura sinensis]|uniref:beta-porphyranase A-like n=1 Tax=Liolophura sinensis TaxID=3198878 RepID=UPI00315822F0
MPVHVKQQQAQQDPHRKGYADPKYFLNPTMEGKVGTKYFANVKGYGLDLDTVMELKEKNWPPWMNTSLHKGTFPNNLDAGADMILLLMEAVSRFTGGHVPPFFEVINEPGTLFATVHWSDIIKYHQLVVTKLKKKFPAMKIGGPTNTGAIQNADRHDFKIWKKLRDFMDMSLNLLDFFSFHAYNHVHKNGDTHAWSGINEARLVAVIDLIESYAWHKKGRSVPLIVSEYGLGGDNVKIDTQSDFDEWAFAYMHNSHMSTYLNFRGDIDRTIAFLLSKSVNFASASLFRHGDYTHVAKAYQFWHHFNESHKFLRVHSEFNNDERRISPLALVNTHKKEIDVILHSYHQTPERVKIKFEKHWAHAPSVSSTCFYLNSHRTPVLLEDQTISFEDNVFTLPAEASCYVSIKSTYNFKTIPTVHEHTYYATEMVIPINSHTVLTTVNIRSLGAVRYAFLRIGVSMSDKTAETKPKTVQVNGHTVTSSYMQFGPGGQYMETLWDVYVFEVPTRTLKQHSNAVQLIFAQKGGYVSTVAIVAGNVPGDGSIIG